MTIPNSLTILRLGLAPVLLLLAWIGAELGFVIVLGSAYLTDAVDGPLARRLHKETRKGPQLDTWADVTIYLCAPLGAWWLWPELIRREALYFIFIIGSIVLPLIIGLLKFRCTTSYHTWLVKIAAVCTTVSSLLLFLQITPLPLRVSSLICVLAGLEEILITLALPHPQSNVRSAWHAMKRR